MREETRPGQFKFSKSVFFSGTPLSLENQAGSDLEWIMQLLAVHRVSNGWTLGGKNAVSDVAWGVY